MSNLRELITELCPDGVEYKSLGDIVSIERGKRLVREQLSEEGKYPVYQNSMTPLGYHTEYNYDAGTTFIIGAGAAGDRQRQPLPGGCESSPAKPTGSGNGGRRYKAPDRRASGRAEDLSAPDPFHRHSLADHLQLPDGGLISFHLHFPDR